MFDFNIVDYYFQKWKIRPKINKSLLKTRASAQNYGMPYVAGEIYKQTTPKKILRWSSIKEKTTLKINNHLCYSELHLKPIPENLQEINSTKMNSNTCQSINL